MRSSNIREREISGIKIITLGQTQLAQVKKAITQTIVARKREEVRDDLREAEDRARDRPGGYAEAPNCRLDGESDDDQDDRISESESNCSEQWYELDGQEQEALTSLRDARKKLQHATKSRRFYPKGGGRARSTGKPIDVAEAETLAQLDSFLSEQGVPEEEQSRCSKLLGRGVRTEVPRALDELTTGRNAISFRSTETR